MGKPQTPAASGDLGHLGSTQQTPGSTSKTQPCLEAEEAAGGPPPALEGLVLPVPLAGSGCPVPCLLPAVHLPGAPSRHLITSRMQGARWWCAQAQISSLPDYCTEGDRLWEARGKLGTGLIGGITPSLRFPSLPFPGLPAAQPDELGHELGRYGAGERRYLEP